MAALQKLAQLEEQREERFIVIEAKFEQRFTEAKNQLTEMERRIDERLDGLEEAIDERLREHGHEPVPPGEDASEDEIRRYQQQVLRQATTPSPPGERAKIDG